MRLRWPDSFQPLYRRLDACTLLCKVNRMNDAEAAQQLQTIRSLMERAALYRRALGPVLLNLGVFGNLGMVIGMRLVTTTSHGFLTLWLSIAVFAILVAFLLIRRQAFRAQETFWTPPTRRVAGAMLPPLLAALAATAAFSVQDVPASTLARWLPPVWLACYGMALHSAGFFTLRGVRQLGWAFLLSGAGIGVGFAVLPDRPVDLSDAHLIMGLTFGLGHGVAGFWLVIRERKSTA